jgi:hypothetical protein
MSSHITQIRSRNGVITIEDSIRFENRIIKPFETSSYLNEPYIFLSEERAKDCINRASSETRDTLYRKVESICKKYIVADSSHISLIASDIIFTDSQDKMGLTHYLFFVDDNTKKDNTKMVSQTI